MGPPSSAGAREPAVPARPPVTIVEGDAVALPTNAAVTRTVTRTLMAVGVSWLLLSAATRRLESVPKPKGSSWAGFDTLAVLNRRRRTHRRTPRRSAAEADGPRGGGVS